MRHVGRADFAGPGQAAHRRFGREWMARAIRQACADDPPRVMVLLGNLVEDARRPGADLDMNAIADEARTAGIPFLVVPGACDGNPDRLFRLFDDHPGAHQLDGYILYSFADPYDKTGRCTRPQRDIDAFLGAARHAPVIALQHNPVSPDPDGPGHPCTPTNADTIRRSYERANVVLSLSGYDHPDPEPVEINGTTYMAAPALSTPPFRFGLITLDGRKVTVERRQLAMPPRSALFDYHTHSHFGYCAEDVHPVKSLERARVLGLSGLACVEHAGQIYLPPEDFWSARHVNDPRAIEQAREAPTNRMPAFRNVMRGFRSDELRIGLEVECDCDGKLNLLEEDRAGWDLLLGAIHWMPHNVTTRDPAGFKNVFMELATYLVTGGIDILAHPFRVFAANKQPHPTDLYKPLAQLLKQHHVAAEVNCHNTFPDPRFFRVCADEGTRIVCSSDAHRLNEVGDLHPHLRLIEKIGLTPADIGLERDLVA